MEKAFTEYSDGQLRADPCLDYVDGRVTEQDGTRFMGGGESRVSMGQTDNFGRDVWHSGVWTDSPVPPYTVIDNPTSPITPPTSGVLTPKSIELLTMKGM